MIVFNVFLLCYYHLPSCKRAWLIIYQTWIPFIQGCFLQNVVEIGPVVLKKKNSLKVVNTSSLCWYYRPLDKGMVLLLNKHESPSRIGAFSQVWLNLAHWISLFRKGVALQLDKFEFSLSNKYFFQLVEICSVVLENTIRVRGINYFSKGPTFFSRGDNSGIAITHWRQF